jgi:hypothetical protein
MKTFNSLNIVTSSNGIVRVYGDGGMVFEARCDYVKAETFIDCGNSVASGTIPKLKKPEEKPLKKNESWAINSFFCTKRDGEIGVFKCVSYDITRGFLMLGVSGNLKMSGHYASELDICRSHQIADDKGNYWETKLWPSSDVIKVPKD